MRIGLQLLAAANFIAQPALAACPSAIAVRRFGRRTHRRLCWRHRGQGDPPAVERQIAVLNCGTAYDVKNALDAGGSPTSR
jgi:hypothetical protein